MVVRGNYGDAPLNKAMKIQCRLQAVKLGASSGQPQTASSSGRHGNAQIAAAVSQPIATLPGNVTAA